MKICFSAPFAKKSQRVDSKCHVEFGRKELLGPPFNLDSKFERAQNLLRDRERGRCVWSEGMESGSFAWRKWARASDYGSVSLPPDLPVEKECPAGEGANHCDLY